MKMNMNINIDKYSNLPIYRQVVDEIVEKIRLGEISYGAKLPTERQLMVAMGISRGTVKKAYEELEKQKVITIVWGSGAYVCLKNKGISPPEEDMLFDSINDRLSELELSLKEKKLFLKIALNKREVQKKIKLCIISNSKEFLKIYTKQLEKVEGVKSYGILAEEIKKSKNKAFLASMFDIFCATSEYEDFIKNTLNISEKKFIALEGSISFETSGNLAELVENGEIGIFCDTIGFKNSINNYFSAKNIRIADKDCIYTKWCGEDEFSLFCKNKKAIIIPPFYALTTDDEICKAMENYMKKGGSFNFFSYTISRDSIKLLDDTVRDMLYNMND